MTAARSDHTVAVADAQLKATSRSKHSASAYMYSVRRRRLRPGVACADCHEHFDPSLISVCALHKHHVVRKIVSKYKTYARNVEFRRLRSIVPALANKRDASKADILEEAIRYIDCLHERLLATVERLPPQATSDGSGCSEAETVSAESDSSVLARVQASLQPTMAARLAQRRTADRAAISASWPRLSADATARKHTSRRPRANAPRSEASKSPASLL